MNTIVEAAAVQISPVLYSRQGTVEKIIKKIHEPLRETRGTSVSFRVLIDGGPPGGRGSRAINPMSN